MELPFLAGGTPRRMIREEEQRISTLTTERSAGHAGGRNKNEMKALTYKTTKEGGEGPWETRSRGTGCQVLLGGRESRWEGGTF